MLSAGVPRSWLSRKTRRFDGALEVKATWRKAGDIPQAQLGRYYTATVITYHGTDDKPVAYNEVYALVALHIIHKTPNYPTLIFATFEHLDALTLPDTNSPTVWKYYQLKGVQAIPLSDQTDPDYYLANIMVESSQPGIQLFRGSNDFPIPPDHVLTHRRNFSNIRVPDFDNTTHSLTMGGCMGCHGIAQSQLKQGFSFLFDAINPKFVKDKTGFSNPETIGLPDARTMQERARKYPTSLQSGTPAP